MSTRIVVLPPAPALLPEYRGRVDAIADLRAACHEAIAWLTDGDDSPVHVLADPLTEADRRRGVREPAGARVARSLLGDREIAAGPARRLLVLANGSASRNEKAPGHLDDRSFAFDERIETALGRGDSTALAGLDAGLGRVLLAAGIEPLKKLGAMDLPVTAAKLLHAADPYGVRYWAATWDAVTRG